jgi:hypothetical protein
LNNLAIIEQMLGYSGYKNNHMAPPTFAAVTKTDNLSAAGLSMTSE